VLVFWFGRDSGVFMEGLRLVFVAG
jgi:hypothetical protein